MRTPEARLEAARKLAIQMTQDTEPEVSWFLAAAKLDYNEATGEPVCVTINEYLDTSFHFSDQPGLFADPTVEDIASEFIDWIRNAIAHKLVLADNSSTSRGTVPSYAMLLGLIHSRLGEDAGADGAHRTGDTPQDDAQCMTEHRAESYRVHNSNPEPRKPRRKNRGAP